MNEELKEILKENAMEYFKNGVEAEKKKEYNSAVTLFFNTISSLADLFILIKEGKMPGNHTERFRIMQTKYPDIYKILDKNFPFYQDSYRLRLNKETNNLLKNDAEKLFKMLDIRI